MEAFISWIEDPKENFHQHLFCRRKKFNKNYFISNGNDMRKQREALLVIYSLQSNQRQKDLANIDSLR